MTMFMVTIKRPVPVLCYWPRRVWFRYVSLQFRKIRLNIILCTHTRKHAQVARQHYKTLL